MQMHRTGKRATTVERMRDKRAGLKRLRRKLAKAKRFGSQGDVDEVQRAIDTLRDQYDFCK